MRQRPNLYPEVTTIRLREGTLDALHEVARQRRTTCQEMMRAAVERLVGEPSITEAARDRKGAQAA